MWCPVLITVTGLLLREQQAQAVLLCVCSSTTFLIEKILQLKCYTLMQFLHTLFWKS